MATRQTKFENFQFNLSHKITAADSSLSKCHLTETELYNFCTETKEMHCFGNVPTVNIFGLHE